MKKSSPSRTFLHKLCPLNAFLDLFFVHHMSLARKGLVQSCPVVIVSQRILSTEKQQFYLHQLDRLLKCCAWYLCRC